MSNGWPSVHAAFFCVVAHWWVHFSVFWVRWELELRPTPACLSFTAMWAHTNRKFGVSKASPARSSVVTATTDGSSCWNCCAAFPVDLMVFLLLSEGTRHGRRRLKLPKQQMSNRPFFFIMTRLITIKRWMRLQMRFLRFIQESVRRSKGKRFSSKFYLTFQTAGKEI